METSTDLIRLDNSTFNGIIPPGAFVVGKYTAGGTKEEDGEVYGSSRSVNKQVNAISQHAERIKGSEPLPEPEPEVKSKKKKGKALPPPPMVFTPAPEIEDTIDVVFSTGFGNITLTACAVLDSEQAVALVFKNARELKFVPTVGTWLQVKIAAKEMKMYFPGLIFTWMDITKKVMILMKESDEA